jgi:peptidyl-prolyl cis-trans isomerase C
VSGCDAINAIREYFQEPDKKSEVLPAAPKNMPSPPTPQLAAPQMKANTLARVGNWTITLEEFNDRLVALKEVVPEFDVNDPEAKKLILEELINQQVLVLGAQESGLANQKDIVAAVDEFRRTLIVREVARTLTENSTVTEEEASAFYNENKESLVGPDAWHVREIVAPTKAQATSILAEILNGADFAETARLRSAGKSAANGGDLGFITQEPFPQMGEAVLPLKEGEISDVFEGPEGFYFVKLEEKKPGAQLTYEEVKDDILQSQTMLKQQQAILDHLNALKEKMTIEIHEQLLQ